MKVQKENKVMMYKANTGKFSLYMNVGGEQVRCTVFPNLNDDLKVEYWSGNVYNNEDEQEDYQE